MTATPFPPAPPLPELEQALASEPGVVLYLSTPDCGVCRALRPKVESLVGERFPALAGYFVDCAAQPDIAARFGVFAVPVVLVFFEGREWVRGGRATGLGELAQGIQRPYDLVFSP